jgi:hypothetical protein
VIRDGHPPERGLRMSEHNVTPLLPIRDVADLLEGPDELSSGHNGEAPQPYTSMISSVIGGGSGSPCASRLSR